MPAAPCRLLLLQHTLLRVLAPATAAVPTAPAMYPACICLSSCHHQRQACYCMWLHCATCGASMLAYQASAKACISSPGQCPVAWHIHPDVLQPHAQWLPYLHHSCSGSSILAPPGVLALFQIARFCRLLRCCAGAPLQAADLQSCPLAYLQHCCPPPLSL
jgi:hypothetical protein